MPRTRLEVRLDEDRRRKLETIAATRGKPISDVVRQLIDRAYEDVRREERLRAARELAALEIEDVPEPEVLSRQLASAYDSPDLP